ncbi:thrombospondin type 3 repeat-containing protein [Putridiphycobacter roseus]|nr:thrombospondin type 3 repeat-containing protein [Putridiphycobacter roseus]
MKKFTLSLSMLMLSLGTVFGQTSDQKIGLTVGVGLSDYYGDWNTSFFNTNKAYRTQVGIAGAYYLNPWFNLGLGLNYGAYGFHVPGVPGDGTNPIPATGFNSDMFTGTLQLRMKFNNGVILAEDAMVRPFIFGGGGVANFANNGAPGLDFSGNAGLGVDVMLNDNLGINYTGNYGYTTGDDRDLKADIAGGHDQYIIHTIGLTYLFGKTVDTDGDGVSDKKDKCPTTPKGVKVDQYGCALDTDGDGIADHLDDCPKIKGIEKFKGCPDTDGDGIKDSEDACPTVKGIASANGCPDADGDGIVDSLDACPDVAGIEKFKGCPDTDGDGIQDSEDECPTVKGPATLKGCPDTDGDGILDKADKCPTIAGVAANNGCPEIKESTKEVFRKALKGIQFESGKDIIKRSSNGILNNVAEIMKENPTYKLKIDGHTDAQGNDDKNMELSKKRATAVKNYLVSKGVEASRLTSFGYGETVPKATNDTSAGRAENRRVEFTVEF